MSCDGTRRDGTGQESRRKLVDGRGETEGVSKFRGMHAGDDGREVPGPAKCRTHLPCTTCLTGQKKVGRISGTRAIGLVAPEGRGHGFGGFGPPLPACLLVELGCVWPVIHPCKLRRQRCSLAMMQHLRRHYTRTRIHSGFPRHGVISCLSNTVVSFFPLFLDYFQMP